MVTKRAPSETPDKKNKDDKKKPSKNPDKKSKKPSKSKLGGLFKFILNVVILLVIVGLCYYGYQFYVGYQKNGGDTSKALNSVKDQATNDYSNASDNIKKNSKVAYNSASEWSAKAYENSEEYLKTAKEFTKESYNDLAEKVKKIGDKTPEELSSSADNYLKEFMHGKEMSDPEAKTRDDTKETKPEVNIQEPKAEDKTPEALKPEKKNDPEKNGFVTPEKTKEKEKPLDSNKEEPKKTGLTKTNVIVGDKNEKVITKPDEPKPLDSKKTSDPVSTVEQPHMKIYKEGRAYFLEGLVHYKKQMPGQPNENVHRRQAYALFKKAAACFDKVGKKMEGVEEFDRISTDNHRYMFGCGKSMTINH